VNRDRSKTRKEAYFVQVESVDKTPYFVNVSDKLGNVMQFSKPLATVAMRVTDDSVLFSAFKPSSKKRGELATTPMSLPMGPLSRMSKQLSELEKPVEPGMVVVEMDGVTHTFSMRLNENGIATLDSAVDQEEVSFELPIRMLQLTLFLAGPKGRTIVLGWGGYQNKPGSPETVMRAAAFAINHLTSLVEFTLLTGISKVTVPAPPGRSSIVRPALKASDQVRVNVPVRLWTDETTPTNVASGIVGVNVNLETANPLTGHLMLEMSPAKELAETFDSYRLVLDEALQSVMRASFGPEEMQGIAVDITLGEVGSGLLERLRESLAGVTGFDLSPRQSVPFPS
jgi:hypothetical protein